MNSYYVLKLLNNQGIYRPDTLVIDDVEVRSPKNDSSKETKVIKKSIEENKQNLDIEFNSRIATIIKTENEEKAKLLADQKFVKILDVLSDELVVSNVSLSKCGYIKNLENGEIKPLITIQSTPGTAFIRATSQFQRLEFSQWVTIQNTELSKRYLRSLHWSRNAKWEENAQLRIIFRWFAVEALFKKEESDRVDPLIRWFLGYPNGHSAQYITAKTRESLQSNPIYENWKNKITSSIDKIREFRNDSIHNGFTNLDINQTDLIYYDQIMMFGLSRCIGAVKRALLSGVSTVDEFKEYISVIFESNENLANDVHNTILYSLEADDLGFISKNTYS